ncbi:heme biosynthesis protein HemY [Roseovarius sp. EL26]|uniref:heme biosynthesis protein HemY n=1 Tax=Roseovarius sp. EL26 TaxID=2126672 RepID=UPI000EA28FF3|nr:heme biosynthesis HemY N-terminal domain-containing protein [Roseovarius sp. EL26]
MLWSITKIVVFIALIAAAAYGAIVLLSLEGGVRIEMAGQEYNLTLLTAVIALILLVVAVWLALKVVAFLVALLKFINGDETAISRYFNKNRQEKGYKALADGILALASGEGDVAMAKAAKADKYLNKPALTNLITAQAAEIKGDHKKAEEVYKKLLKNEKTRFVGVRGLMQQKLEAGDTQTALKLAETAFALKPKHTEVQDALLSLQAKNEDWSGARGTLRAKLKHGALPRDVHKRRDAVLALSEARGVWDDGNDIAARETAIEANKMSPDLVPAAAMAAQSYIAQGSKRNATRLIVKAWNAQPHPDLAAVFAEIEPDETPAARLKRFGKLLKLHSDHRETKLLGAELQIAAEDFPAARRAMGDLVETEPDTRILTLMAAIERGEGADDAVVRAWLARALAAPRGPQWVCDSCQHIHTDWVPSCENCESFDTLSWRAPPVSATTGPIGFEMLPLLVGGRADTGEVHDEADSDTGSDDIEDAEVLDASEEGTDKTAAEDQNNK